MNTSIIGLTPTLKDINIKLMTTEYYRKTNTIRRRLTPTRSHKLLSNQERCTSEAYDCHQHVQVADNRKLD